MKKQLLSYLKTIQNILMTLLDGSQVSDCCPLGYLFSYVSLQDCMVLINFCYTALGFLFQNCLK